MSPIRTLSIALALACIAPAQFDGFDDDVVRDAVAFAALPTPDAERRVKARMATDAPACVRMLRAGLAHADRAVARACALHLDWRMLDAGEHARVVELLREAYAAEDTPVDFDRFRSIAGSADLAWIYANVPPPPWDGHVADHLSALHRQARAEHIPALLALTAHADGRVRGEAWRTLMTITPRSDRYLASIARAYLAIDTTWHALLTAEPKVATGGPVFPTPAEPDVVGLLAELRAVLRRDVTRAGGRLPAWALRWLAGSIPIEEDARLLIDLADAVPGDDATRHTALRAMRHLEDAATAARLARAAADPDPTTSTIAVAALATRGDDAMKARLAERMPQSALAVALFAELDPDALRTRVAKELFGGDARTARRWLDALGDVEERARHTIDADVNFASLQATALASGLDGVDLARAAVTLRGLNTEAIARAAAERMRTGDLPTLPHGHALGFVEVGAPGALRAVLDRMHASDNTNLTELAAVLDGPLYPERPVWPPRLIDALAKGMKRDDPRLDGMLYAFLMSNPTSLPAELWRVGRQGVAPCLRRMRDQRDLGIWAEATAQLACLGDESAREECMRALRDGRYRWVDTVFADPHYAVFGDDLDGMIPFWLGELESNCCRAVIARGVFEKLFGLDPHVLGDAPGETEATQMRRWWRIHHDDDFRFSRIANRWIPISRTR